ncbi:MAG: DUF2103 domain-containing protein [Minisyncoccia bacterium]
MPFRDGKKIRGSHTTLIDLAARVTDIARRMESVTGISPGWIKSGKNAYGGGGQRVKFGDFKGGLVLVVRQSHTIQELRVFSTNIAKTRLALARALRDEGIPIAFRH